MTKRTKRRLQFDMELAVGLLARSWYLQALALFPDTLAATAENSGDLFFRVIGLEGKDRRLRICVEGPDFPRSFRQQ